jgi:hypothetical protein
MIAHFISAQASLLARHFSFAVKHHESISLILFLLRFALKGIRNIQKNLILMQTFSIDLTEKEVFFDVKDFIISALYNKTFPSAVAFFDHSFWQGQNK